jgi:hypothetical protein
MKKVIKRASQLITLEGMQTAAQALLKPTNSYYRSKSSVPGPVFIILQPDTHKEA